MQEKFGKEIYLMTTSEILRINEKSSDEELILRGDEEDTRLNNSSAIEEEEERTLGEANVEDGRLDAGVPATVVGTEVEADNPEERDEEQRSIGASQGTAENQVRTEEEEAENTSANMTTSENSSNESELNVSELIEKFSSSSEISFAKNDSTKVKNIRFMLTTPDLSRLRSIHF